MVYGRYIYSEWAHEPLITGGGHHLVPPQCSFLLRQPSVRLLISDVFGSQGQCGEVVAFEQCNSVLGSVVSAVLVASGYIYIYT